MSKRAFLLGLAAFISPMLANAETFTDDRLYVVYGAGALVMLLMIIVVLVAVRFVRTFNKIVADEVPGEQDADVRASVKTNHTSVQPAVKLQSLVRRIRWISYTIVSSVIMVATAVVFINATSNRTGVASAKEIPSPPPSDEPFTVSTNAELLDKGRQIFMGTCSACHGNDGGGSQIGPNLTDEFWLHGGEPDSVFRTVSLGVASRGMPAWGKALTHDNLNAVVNFVLSLEGSAPKNAREPQGVKFVKTGSH